MTYQYYITPNGTGQFEEATPFERKILNTIREKVRRDGQAWVRID